MALNNGQTIAKVYGSNWVLSTAADTFDTGEIVEIRVKGGNVKSFKSVCNPVLDHCHIALGGVHSKLHIRNPSISNTPTSVEYNSQTCLLKEIRYDTRSTWHPTYIPEDFGILDGEAYAVFVREIDDEFFLINNCRIINHISRQHHNH